MLLLPTLFTSQFYININLSYRVDGLRALSVCQLKFLFLTGRAADGQSSVYPGAVECV